MKKIYLLFFFVSYAILSCSQTNDWWEKTNFPTGIPLHSLDYFSPTNFVTATDEQNGMVYLAGINNFYTTGFFPKSIYTYDGENWDLLVSYMGSTIQTMSVFQGSLYMGSNGGMTYRNEEGIVFGGGGYLTRFDGNSWMNMPVAYGGVHGLKVIDDTLYVGGQFTHVDGEESPMITKYDGENWHQIPDNPFWDLPDFGTIYSFAKYEGDLYMGGVSPNVNDDDLMYYNDGVWQAVGDGINGLNTKINFLEVYQGELYAAGIILQDEGNPGNGIQKWNGTTWTEVGDGLSDTPIFDMTIFQDRLYVSGPVSTAGDVGVNGVATWDGEKWCGLQTYTPGQIIPGVFTLADSLYMPLMHSNTDPFFSLDQSSPLEMYKWIGGENYGPCTVTTSVNFTDGDGLLSIYPNPSADIFYLNGCP